MIEKHFFCFKGNTDFPSPSPLQSSQTVGGLLKIKVQLIISLSVFPLFSFWRHEL